MPQLATDRAAEQLSPLRILLIAGGWSPERAVSLRGAEQIAKALGERGHRVRLFDLSDGMSSLLDLCEGQDVAFINLHGAPGEDGLVQALLERVGLPYQGSGPAGSFLALNKAAAKSLFRKAGLRTPDWIFLPEQPPQAWRPDLPWPLFIKSNTGGSSLHMFRARIIIPWQPGLGEGAQDLADEQLDEARNTLLALEASLSEMRGGAVHIHAPRNADEHRLVDMAKSNAREAARTSRDLPLEDRLATVLGWKEPVRRIECVDVSHTGGQSTKVGMVVYEDGKPKKSDYRAYNIEGANGDDYLALSQWAERRFAHGAQSPDWPDLLLIDGGKGQLTAVYRVFAEAFGQALGPEAGPESKIPFLIAGIAKARDEQGQADRRAGNVSDRIFLPGRSNPLPIRPGSAELLFLQAVRDATHDFALGRHRQARAKRAFSGELQRLPGVGPHTAKLLWDNFDSLEAMKKARAEDIAKLPGIGPKKAEKIWTSLQAL